MAARLQGFLVARDPQFDAKLDALVTALGSQAERDAALAGLDDTQTAFALDIAKPWYLGYVGTPSDYVFDDDAELVTFHEAQNYQKLIDKVPRSSYPDQGPAWWGGPPDGVTAPDMPRASAAGAPIRMVPPKYSAGSGMARLCDSKISRPRRCTAGKAIKLILFLKF